MNELEIQQTGTQLISQSQSLVISTELGYSNAVEVCKDIKIKISAIEKYWGPLKTNAFQAHKDICSKEKELLKPYVDAETGIKNKMVAWQRKIAEEASLLREEQERYRKDEESRLMELAVKAAAEGHEEHSEFLVEQAQEMHTAVFKQADQVKVSGSAVKTTWKARVTNADIVPISFAGAVIRPVDTKVLDGLAKVSKGTMVIPGVEFFEDISVSVSRG